MNIVLGEFKKKGIATPCMMDTHSGALVVSISRVVDVKKGSFGGKWAERTVSLTFRDHPDLFNTRPVALDSRE